MGRPRGFSVEAVVAAAKQQFWRDGYEGSTLDKLETTTGLSRSSLYQAFGSKEALFGQVLDEYIASFVDPLLTPMERPQARPGDVAQFFRQLATLFRDDELGARRGCLWVNAIAQFGSGTETLDARADEFAQRLGDAFVNALSGSSAATGADPRLGARRARLLTATTFGVWLAVRIDVGHAVRICEDTAAEVRSWG